LIPIGLESKGRESGLFYALTMRVRGLTGIFSLLTLAGAASANAPAGFDCNAPALGASTGVTRSVWEEASATGRRLVREQGTLTRYGISADGACGAWQWRLALARSTGQRAYDGVSTTNFPIQTTSDLTITDASAQIWAHSLQNWSAGMRLNQRRLDRRIAGTGPVLGYPERFSYWQAAAGLRRELALAPGWVVSAEGWLGGGPGGTLDLRLPNADAAELKLGKSRLAEIGLQIESPALPVHLTGWSWHARADYQWQRMAAGDANVITRNGIPIGGAAQPETVQKALALSAGVRYRF
jgi:hypothetical protein